ncbi:Zinc finger and BTB domain-containing protein 16-A [Orchesella cincta]|uniref:Zinc finger and BTB domain-containing protein 16-A n=1 Tax=Orchesella cincta TaxID=48709 RepID=A0A1D2M7Z1_ORCCI|nr:Zinc finger and BTB domain-containing protein 16-A [Orchesella cincta]
MDSISDCKPSPCSSGNVEELKVSFRLDSCLLCAGTAVVYDAEGKVIKRESTNWSEDVVGNNWSNGQLFMFLCQALNVKKKWKKKNGWKLQLDPFPFCETCEGLINSLAEVYSKLEELQSVIKWKLEEAEQLFMKDNLYEKHERAYLEFRKDALGEKVQSAVLKRSLRRKSPRTKMSKVSHQKVNDEVSAPSKQTEVSPSTTLQSENSISDDEEMVDQLPVTATPEDDPLDPGFEADVNIPTPGRMLRKRARKTEQRSISTATSKNEEHDDQSQVPTLSVVHDTIPNDDDCQSPQAKPRRKCRSKKKKATPPSKMKRISRCVDTVSVAISKNERIELKRTTYKKGRSHGFMERDPTTGGIAYTTGFGNRFGTYRTTLNFKQVELEGDKFGYECTSCSQTFPLLISSDKQQKVFFAHYLSAHSDRYKCKVCKYNPPRYANRQELLKHLESTHGIKTISDYHNKRQRRKDLTPEMIYNGCRVCGKPGLDCRSSDYRQHLLSHMNEEEKLEALTVAGRRHKELLAPTQQQLENDSTLSFCQSCGRFITKGELGLKRHQLEFHPDLVDPAEKSNVKNLCSICGATLYNKTSLRTHMKSQHPNGKWDGPLKCKFPGCSHNSTGEPNLKVHVEEEHGQSEEARRGVLCTTCGKILSSAWTLKGYKYKLQNFTLCQGSWNVHSGAKPWKCSICSKAFPLKNTLELHLTTKHGVGAEVFKCEVEGCGKLYPIRRYLTLHKRTVHGIFTKKRKSQRDEGEGVTQ